MEFRLDSHTHTLASGHAYCTLLEMVRAAADRGLELICITDHAPGMELTTQGLLSQLPGHRPGDLRRTGHDGRGAQRDGL